MSGPCGDLPVTISAIKRRFIEEKADRGDTMEKYQCMVCGHIYDPAKGEPKQKISAGIAFADLPDDWVCPVCGAAKTKFKPVA
jgi:rubredoxin